MNKNVEALTAEFKSKYEKFQIGCDALEEMDLWDKNELGEMNVYYQNELISIILKLIVADGTIGIKEAEYFNKNFGFDCSVEDLQEIYKTCSDNLETYFDENFANGLVKMRSINDKIADCYKELLVLICDIIAYSDDTVTDKEKEEIQRIRDHI